MSEPPSPSAAVAEDRKRLRDDLYAFTRTQLLHVAARLGLPDLLAAEPLPAEVVAARTGSDPDALARVLRGLAAMGVAEEGEDGRFALTALGEGLRPGAAGSLHGLALLVGAEYWAAWAGLPEAVRTGETAFDRVFGRSLFGYLGDNPEAHDRFNRWMVAATTSTASAVVAAYDFSGSSRVVDVGGGYGALLAAVLGAFPDLCGVLFDLPEVAALAKPHLEAAGVADRCQVVGGDFFAAVPAADTYLLSQILHDWDDDRCLAILRACRAAIAAEGRLLVVEVLLPERVSGPSFAVDQDLFMLAITGGRERTAADYGRLFAAAGFELARVVPTSSPREASVVEARPV